MKKSQLRKISIFIFIFTLIFTGIQAWGFVTRKGESIIINSDEIINEDLYLAGKSIIVEGTVNGDLWAAGESVVINGNVRDNISVAGEEISMFGTTGKSFKALGKNIRIGGKVSGDLLLWGEKLEIKQEADIGGDFLIGAKSAQISGIIHKDLIGGGENITIDGTIGGNVKLGVRDLKVTSSSIVKGDLTYLSKKEALISPGAEIDGLVTKKIPSYLEKWIKISPLIRIVSKIASFFMILLTGLIFILITPRWMRSSADFIKRKPGKCAGWGGLIIFVTPLFAAIAMLTIVGIPIAVIISSIYITALIISQVASGLFLGRLVIMPLSSSQKKGFLFLSFTVGTVIIYGLSFIPVVKYIVIFLTTLFGIGSLLVSLKTGRIR